MIISINHIDLRRVFIAALLGCVLTYAALTEVDQNLQISNYIKFFIFILILPNLLKINHETENIRAVTLVALAVYLQVALIIAGYFFADVTAQIGKMVGFHVSAKHEFILSRAPFDPWKRSFSIFDNPNVAARLLILTLLYYACISSKIRLNMLFLVLIATMATGSRAAILVFMIFVLWSAVFNKQQGQQFRIVLIVAVVGILSWIAISSISYRIFDVVSMVTSATKKAEIASLAFSSSTQIGVYDTDIALIYHQFGLGGIAVLLIMILQNMNVSRNITIIACAYCFSGSLIFSTPNIAVLLLLKFVGRPQWHYLR